MKPIFMSANHRYMKKREKPEKRQGDRLLPISETTEEDSPWELVDTDFGDNTNGVQGASLDR